MFIRRLVLAELGSARRSLPQATRHGHILGGSGYLHVLRTDVVIGETAGGAGSERYGVT